MPDDSNQLNRRKFLSALLSGVVAAGASWSERVQAQDDDPLKIKSRFTLPAGKEADFPLPPIRDPNNYLRWGMNGPVGTPGGSQIILAGDELDAKKAVLGTRMVDETHFIHPGDGEKPYILLGATKVEEVEAGSAIISFVMEPGQNLQLLNMAGTIVVSEESGEQPPPKKLKELTQRLGYSNDSGEAQQVMLIIPPDEHAMKAGHKKNATDLELLRKGIDIYVKEKNPKKKAEIYAKINFQTWSLFANAFLDAGIQTSPEELGEYYNALVLAQPKINTPKARIEALNEQKDKLDSFYDHIMKNREGKNKAFIFSKEEIEAIFKKDPESSRKKPLLLDFIERVVPSQIKQMKPEGKGKK